MDSPTNPLSRGHARSLAEMLRSVSQLISLTFLSVAVGCASATGPEGTLDFNVVQLPSSVLDPPEVTAEGGEGRIAVTGVVTVGDPCHDVSGRLIARRLAVTLEVEARRQQNEDVACPDVVTSFAYEAVIRELVPGTYRVRVDHAGAMLEEFRGTAFDGSVAVR